MALRNGKPWMNVYPLHGRGVEIRNSKAKMNLSKELSDYCNELWESKAEKGWKNSWVALAKKISFSEKNVLLDTGAMPFHIIDGINKSIEEGKSFAPKEGYNPIISIGFLTATEDEKVIFQRRDSNVHCPNVLIHEPCGYMTSMAFSFMEKCKNSKYARDKRLIDLSGQLDFRKKEIAKTFGLESEAVSYNFYQDLFASGWMTTEMYFSTTGKINFPEDKLKKPKDQEIFFVPFEHLKELIRNQGKLSKINPRGYRPEDPRKIPLIDESLSSLIWSYEKLTGEKLDIEETVNRLNSEGMDIKVYNTSPSKEYKFLKVRA